MKARTILAIDPGTAQSAYVLWDSHDKQIIEKGIVPNDDVLRKIGTLIYDAIAIEMIASYGMSVGKEVFQTCVWIGRFIQRAAPIRTDLIYRREVKMFLCGSMRAKDSNIRQALIDMLGKDTTKGVSKDVWAALGVAVTYCG